MEHPSRVLNTCIGHVSQQHVSEEREGDEVFINKGDDEFDSADERPAHKKIGLDEGLDKKEGYDLEGWLIS